jgi:hypothetical protein
MLEIQQVGLIALMQNALRNAVSSRDGYRRESHVLGFAVQIEHTLDANNGLHVFAEEAMTNQRLWIAFWDQRWQAARAVAGGPSQHLFAWQCCYPQRVLPKNHHLLAIAFLVNTS